MTFRRFLMISRCANARRWSIKVNPRYSRGDWNLIMPRRFSFSSVLFFLFFLFFLARKIKARREGNKKRRKKRKSISIFHLYRCACLCVHNEIRANKSNEVLIASANYLRIGLVVRWNEVRLRLGEVRLGQAKKRWVERKRRGPGHFFDRILKGENEWKSRIRMDRMCCV